MEVQKNRIGSMVMLLVALVAASAIVSQARSINNACKPSSSHPVDEVALVSSQDNTAIFSFRGHLEWYSLTNKTNTYIPLDVKQLNSIKDTKYQHLSLYSSCNAIRMSLKKVNQNYQLDEIEVSQNDANGESKYLCTAPLAKPIVLPEENGCEYKLPQKWGCYEQYNGNTVESSDANVSMIWLVAYEFKFEFDGNQEMIKQKQFSKPAKEF